jgi:hypothetical protein
MDGPVRALVQVEDKQMYDCSNDVLAYHDDEVTLPQTERDEMRDRRNANRDRLKRGLKKAGGPQPVFNSQGSYAMLTMVQYPDKAYDIDDGVYFAKENLTGPHGGEMSALEARQMVRDAVDDGSFKTPPEVRSKCVRVHYAAGYHVDLPVYRRVIEKDLFGTETEHYELAASEWKRSDARHVTKWFDEENRKQSPDIVNGRQLRRVTREIKKFAVSRSSWKGPILNGFGITKLVTERYRKDGMREDVALHDTMRAIRDRLNVNLVVQHPCTPDDTITTGQEDSKAVFLRDRFSEALAWLEPLSKVDCDRETALKCWDKVFATKFFSNRLKMEKEAQAGGGGLALLTSGLLRRQGDDAAAQRAVRKEGGGRYA